MPSAVTSFWNDVRRLLTEQYNLSSAAADEQITEYRSKFADPDLLGAMMHFGPERLAAGIKSRLRPDKETPSKSGPKQRIRIISEQRLSRPKNIPYGHGPDIVVTLIKRLSRTDLGLTRSHQRGEIQMPRQLIAFFPSLDKRLSPPSARIEIKFKGESASTPLRLVFYDKVKGDYRLTKVPDQVLLGAQNGDLLVLRKGVHSFFDGAVVKQDDRFYDEVSEELGSKVGVVKEASFPKLF